MNQRALKAILLVIVLFLISQIISIIYTGNGIEQFFEPSGKLRVIFRLLILHCRFLF